MKVRLTGKAAALLLTVVGAAWWFYPPVPEDERIAWLARDHLEHKLMIEYAGEHPQPGLEVLRVDFDRLKFRRLIIPKYWFRPNGLVTVEYELDGQARETLLYARYNWSIGWRITSGDL